MQGSDRYCHPGGCRLTASIWIWKEMPAIPTQSLALVEAFVGPLEQKEAIIRVVGATRAQGDRGLELPPLLVAYPRQQMMQSRLQLVALPRQQGSKLVSPDPIDGAGAKLGSQQLGYPAKHTIPHAVTPAVVDALEIVHIEQHKPIRRLDLVQLASALGKGSSVHDAGKGVVQQRI